MLEYLVYGLIAYLLIQKDSYKSIGEKIAEHPGDTRATTYPTGESETDKVLKTQYYAEVGKAPVPFLIRAGLLTDYEAYVNFPDDPSYVPTVEEFNTKIIFKRKIITAPVTVGSKEIYKTPDLEVTFG